MWRGIGPFRLLNGVSLPTASNKRHERRIQGPILPGHGVQIVRCIIHDLVGKNFRAADELDFG